MSIGGSAETGERPSLGAPSCDGETDIGRSDTFQNTRLMAMLALVAAVLTLAFGIWLRSVGLDREGFWLDEVFSASFANLSLPGTFLAVLLLDVHPPLYYLQLNVWGRLGHGDTWLLLNSVAWSTGAMLAVYFGTSRRFGSLAGLLALTICAVMGGEIYFAHELRMYPMASCLAVLSWIAANRLHKDYRFVTALPLIIVLALLGAIHSGSIIPASGALLYAYPSGNRQQIRRRLPTWIGIWAVVVCTYLPWLVSASSRDSIRHASLASKHALIQTIGGWIIGYGDAALPSWVGTGAAIVVALGLLASVLASRRLSRLVLCFLVWPLLFGALLCLIVEPIWLDRTFAFCAPFVAIAFGAALGDWLKAYGATAGKSVVYSMLCLFAAVIFASGRLAYLQASTRNKPDHFRELAHYLAARTAPGELLYAPMDVNAWGVNRYLIGPDWGSVLKYQDIAVTAARKRWRLLNAWLGPAELERLGAMPETRLLDRYRIPVYIGPSPLPDLPTVTGEWLASIEGATLNAPQDLGLCIGQYPAPIKFGRLELYHWRCAGNASALPLPLMRTN
jgi:mannosyltransferase